METINVNIAEGELQGGVYKTPSQKQYYGFTGIPYAEPPIGRNRFQEPVAVKKWDGAKDVTKDSDFFIQYDPLNNIIKGSEILTVNVFTPRLQDQAGAAPFPVVVFIHGGGFIVGSAEKAKFGPDYLIEKDVVVVTVHYRLGLLGFLCLDIPEASGNAGLKDQLLALKWVQRNIAVFNGDPSNVTIMGTSAGAASVEYHLLSPHGSGLFHKAISLSGSAINPWANNTNPIENAIEAAKSLGHNVKEKKELLEFFLSASAEDLARATNYVQQKLYNQQGGLKFSFVPVKEKRFDGVLCFLSESPIDILKSGWQKTVPFITGFCDQEGLLAVSRNPQKIIRDLSSESVQPLLQFKIDECDGILSKLNEIYIKKHESKEIQENRIIDFYGDSDFCGGILVSAKMHAIQNSNVYLHKFTYDGHFNKLKKTRYNITRPRTSHADQDLYIAKNDVVITEEGTQNDQLCRQRMVEMITAFMKTGNPTLEESSLLHTKWGPVEANKMKCLNIGEELTMEDQCELTNLWEQCYAYPLI